MTKRIKLFSLKVPSVQELMDHFEKHPPPTQEDYESGRAPFFPDYLTLPPKEKISAEEQQLNEKIRQKLTALARSLNWQVAPFSKRTS